MDTAALQIEVESFGAVSTRDEALVAFLGRFGVASVRQVMAQFGIGRTAAYRLAAACAERGLIARDDSLRREPSVLYATRQGLRWVGLPYPVVKLAPSLINHSLRCTSIGQMLRREFPGTLHSERDLCWIERQEASPSPAPSSAPGPMAGRAFTGPTWRSSPRPGRSRWRSS